MKRAIRFIMIATAAAVVVFVVAYLGCSPGNHFNYVGTWEARRQLAKPTDPNVTEEAFHQASRVILTVKVDGTFTVEDAGMKRDGEYDIAGDHLVLHVKSIADVPMSRQPEDIQKLNVPISATPIKGDDALRYYDPTGYDRTGLVMHRWKETKKPSP